MQPLDKDTLFSIFESGDEEVYKEHGVEDTLNNPFVLMGMIIQGLQSFELMDVMYKRNYPEEYKKVSKAVKYKYYTRLYNYLIRIDSSKFETVYNIGDSFEVEDVYTGLEELREYFEQYEEYEKCGVVKRYRELLVDKVVDLNKNTYL